MALRCQGLLFDLDGTLIDSLHAVDRAWTTWSLQHGLDPAEILPRIHGRKAIDSIRDILPEADHEAETLMLREIESSDTRGVVALPGAVDLLSSLPMDRWGIVTSGTSDVALARMAAAGIPLPAVAVYGEEVVYGKPHPEPYLTGARRLGSNRSRSSPSRTRPPASRRSSRPACARSPSASRSTPSCTITGPSKSPPTRTGC